MVSLKEIRAEESLLEAARILDQYYISTRYPNGFDVGAPTDYYTKKQAQEAIIYAESILGFVMVEIFPYGWRQFITMLEDYNLIALDTMAEGLAVYIGDTVKWEEVSSVATKVFQQVEPIANGWRVCSLKDTRAT